MRGISEHSQSRTTGAARLVRPRTPSLFEVRGYKKFSGSARVAWIIAQMAGLGLAVLIGFSLGVLSLHL